MMIELEASKNGFDPAMIELYIWNGGNKCLVSVFHIDAIYQKDNIELNRKIDNLKPREILKLELRAKEGE